MKKIKLTQEKFALVDDEDYEYLNQWKWCAAFIKGGWYASRKETVGFKQEKNIFMHIIIMKTKEGEMVDHKDHNGLNCQKNNMRVCNSMQNSWNRKNKQNSYSKFKGVGWYSKTNKWVCRITVHKKTIHLGYFCSEIKAALVYDKAAQKHFGEFAYLNVVLRKKKPKILVSS